MFFGLEKRRIFAYGQAIDMRKSFDGLISLTLRELHEDPLSGYLFVFFNRRGNLIKALTWDRTGYCLFAKRLERGRFCLRNECKKQELNEQLFKLLLDGIELGRKRRM